MKGQNQKILKLKIKEDNMMRTIFDELLDLNNEMNRIFKNYNYSGEKWANTNVYENKDDYVIVSKLPGVAKSDINISIKDHTLKITGERKKDQYDKANLLLNERHNGKFERNFILNEKVDMNNINAEMKNGLLMIKLPKSPESKPKKIEIK